MQQNTEKRHILALFSSLIAFFASLQNGYAESFRSRLNIDDSSGFRPSPAEVVVKEKTPNTQKSKAWGYTDENGPSHWPPTCQDGLRQSPVDIRARDVDYAFINELHFVNYDAFGTVKIRNTGHGVQVEGFDRWAKSPHIYGGGLVGKYTLSQFHFHWSYGHDDGSEHTIGSLHYPVEIHLVHTKDGYSPSEITSQPDGLAVVGVFMTLSEDGTAWATLDSALRKVAREDEKTLVFNYTTGVNLPSNTQNFYRYTGSLTTPGCNEAVIWTLMAEPIGITDAQLKVLREIKIGAHQSSPPDSNARPTQPINGRRILYRSPTLNRERFCATNAQAADKSSEGNSVITKFNSIFDIRLTGAAPNIRSFTCAHGLLVVAIFFMLKILTHSQIPFCILAFN